MRDNGAAGIVLIGVCAVVLILAVLIGAVGAYLDARVRVSAAADAAALAAAPVTFLPFGADRSPADEAARFARLNDMRLDSCHCPVNRSFDPRTVEVRVSGWITLWPVGRVRVSAVSRAEFVPARLLGD